MFMRMRLDLLPYFVLIMMFGMGLHGCTKYLPQPHEHKLLPKTTKTGVRYVKNPTKWPQMKWWKIFNDPQLNQGVEEIIVNNMQLKSQQAIVQQAKFQLKESKYRWLPSLNASGAGFVGGGYNSQITPQGNLARAGLFNQNNQLNFNGYSSGFAPTYSLNILSNIYQERKAWANLQLQQATTASVKLTLLHQFLGAYFMLQGEREQLNIQHKWLKTLCRLGILEQSRYQQGATDLSTVSELQQQIAVQQAALPPLKASISQLENTLLLLVNKSPGNFRLSRNFSDYNVQMTIPKELPSTLLLQRPDVSMAKSQLNIAAQDYGIAGAQYFPNITLNSIFGGASLELSHLLSISTGLWLVEAAAFMPVLNGVTYEQLQEARAGYDVFLYQYFYTLRQAFADVDNRLNTYAQNQNLYKYHSKAYKAALKKEHLMLLRYQEGVVDERLYLQAKIISYQSKLNQTLAKMQVFDSLVQLHQSLAG